MQLPMDYLKDVPREVTVPVALRLMKDALQPGAPSLAGMLGWYQPTDDTTIKAGEAYGTINDFTLRDVLADLGYSQVREIIRFARDTYNCASKQSILDRVLKPGGLVDAEVFMPFGGLSTREKLYYRLAVLVVNAYLGDTHNWACEYMSYLGSQYANQYADENWRMYEQVNKADEVADKLLAEGVKLDVYAEESDYPNTPKPSRLLNIAVAMSIFDPVEYDACLYLDKAELTALVSEIVFSLVDSQADLNLDWDKYDKIHPFDPTDIVYHWADSDAEFPVEEE